MPFLKNAEVRDAKKKYGFENKGVFTNEFIKKGDAIWVCDLAVCDYLPLDQNHSGHSKKETLDIIRKFPENADFIHKYHYMVGDDLFDWPKNWMEGTLNESCMFFNHSCDPNCGFQALDVSLVVAIRDIEVGEELTYDYQFMDTEISFYTGINCKCGSVKCRGVLKFDEYRNVDWQNQYYKYSGAFVKSKIEELKTKWFSARCYIKQMKPAEGSNPRELSLTAFKKIRKDDLVAIFSDKSNISPSAHYIRHNDNPTCYLADNEVYALECLEPETELTLNYNL